jgi:putative hydrolase of the HAD superfamily
VLGAVTLDAAGTLFEPAEPVGVTYARIAARHGIPVAPADVGRRFRAAVAAAPPLAFPDLDPARLANREYAWWADVVDHALEGAAARAGFAACVRELFAHYGRADAWRVYPEVPDTLVRLRQRGLRVGVISNFDGRLPPLLGALALAPLVDVVVHSTAVGAAKPDPRIFREAVARLALSAAEVLHAGDAVVADVEGARAAGLRAVLVDRHDRRPPLPLGVTTITTLAGLVDLTA